MSSSIRSRKADGGEARPPPSAPAGSHNNRGHLYWRATQTAREDVGIGLNLLRHTQGVVTIVTAVGILWTSENAESLWYLGGALATSSVAKVAKKIIKEPRPEGSAVAGTHGMPSTHSSTVTFMCSYLALYSIHRLAAGKTIGVLESLATIVLLAFPPIVMWSRTALGVHTTRQVVAGGTLGGVCAIAWWALWQGQIPVLGTRVLSQGVKYYPLVLKADRIIADFKKSIVDFVFGRRR